MKNLIIFCDGGLGNRLGTLVSGLALARNVYNPIICWPKNNWCGCSLDDLFDLQIEQMDMDINTLFIKKIDHIFLIHENQTKISVPRRLLPTQENIIKARSWNANVVYYNNQVPSFIDDDIVQETLQTIPIKHDIVNEVISFCTKSLGKNPKGIHLRKTDFDQRINEDELYKLIELDSNCVYFLCSDDKLTEDKFKKLKNVVVREKLSYAEKFIAGEWTSTITDKEGRVFPFNVNRSKDSVIDGFKDMLILSRTNIITNTRSSFAQFARRYSTLKL